MARKAEKAVAEAVAEKIVKKGIGTRITGSLWKIFKETWDELFEIILIGHILGMSNKEGGSKMANEKKEGEKELGTGQRMFHAFSHDDEIKWNKLFVAARKSCDGCEELFMKFLHAAVARGYDKDTLRIRLIGSFSGKDENDPAVDTVKTIADMDGDLEKQIQFAKNRELLVRKSFKNFLLKGKENKLAAFMCLVVIILAILRACTWIFA